MRDRKRLIRLLVTDITLIKTDEHITAHVRLSGGQLHTLTAPRRLRWEGAHHAAEHDRADRRAARRAHLRRDGQGPHDQGLTGGWGKPFTIVSLTQLCATAASPDLRQRLRTEGMLTLKEIAKSSASPPEFRS